VSDKLHSDMNLLLVGAVGDGGIPVVILVRWRRLTGSRVEGMIEVYAKDRNGMPICQQRELCSRYLTHIFTCLSPELPGLLNTT
jgi:hypothetical protein